MTVRFDADPDPTFRFDADRDPTFQVNANTGLNQSNAILRPLVLRSSTNKF
jgi:hypothetical protein